MNATKSKGSGPGRGIRRVPGGGELPRKPRPSTGEEAHIPLGRRNLMLLAAGGGAVVLGFVLLAVGDKVFAPILIVGGYLGLIPWGILAASDRPGRQSAPEDAKSLGEGE